MLLELLLRASSATVAEMRLQPPRDRVGGLKQPVVLSLNLLKLGVRLREYRRAIHRQTEIDNRPSGKPIDLASCVPHEHSQVVVTEAGASPPALREPGDRLSGLSQNGGHPNPGSRRLDRGPGHRRQCQRHLVDLKPALEHERQTARARSTRSAEPGNHHAIIGWKLTRPGS